MTRDLILGDEHDYSRRPTNRNHLQHHILPIPRRPLHFRSLHGRSLRKRHRHGKNLSPFYLSLSTHHIDLQLTNISTSQALENCPVDARGLMSGILQQGYSFGYVCAACANLGVGGSTESWKTVFWIAAGLSIGVGLIRVGFPESQQFRERKAAGHKGASPGVFWKETKQMLAREWKMCMLVFFFVVFLFFFGGDGSLSIIMLTD